MKKLLTILLITALLLSSAPLSFAAGGSSAAPMAKDYVANEVIITQRTDMPEREALPFTTVELLETQAIESENARVLKGTVAFGTDIEALCEKLEQREDILSADPNYIQTIESITVPAEATKTGSDYNAFNWYRDSLHLTAAWEQADTLGSSEVVVAVIDTGLNTSHKEFEGALWSDGEGHCGYNAPGANFDVRDSNGHGSHVAGIIAMRANDFGYVGIAPSVTIMPLKAAQSVSFYDSDILTCLNYAVEHGADIINMSYGSSNFSRTMALAYQHAATKAVLVAAAGNSSQEASLTPQYPAAYNGVLGVMSYGSYANKDLSNYTIDNGLLSSFSNYDDSGRFYQLAAPGVSVVAPDYSTTDTFCYKTGTSQAAPIVAGAAALYLSKYPNAAPYAVREALVNSAESTIAGYYESAHRYKKLNIGAAMNCEPCEDPAVALSEPARELLSRCLDTPLSIATRSDLEALSYIPADFAADYKEDLSIISELNTVQYLDFKNLGLNTDALAWIEHAGFERLHKLNVSDNPDLERLRFSPSTAPLLTELYADNCALTDVQSFENLSALYTLSLGGNRFVRSTDFAPLDFVKEFNLSDCSLQECDTFGTFEGTVYLDLSDNYLTDISPLTAFHGAYLDISSNPLSLGVRENDCIGDIECSMNDSPYRYQSITFLHENIDANDGKDYIPAKELQVNALCVPRAAEQAHFEPVLSPENANVHSAYRFESDVLPITPTGYVQWDAETITADKEALLTLNCPGFPTAQTKLTITVPRIHTFRYDGAFTLSANCATEYVTIGAHTLTTFTQIGEERFFTVPDSVLYTPDLIATAFDSYGAGGCLRIASEKSPSESKKSALLAFFADKDSYSVGETATIFVKCNNFTNVVKLTDSLNGTSLISDCYEVEENGRVFSFSVPVRTSGTHRFKAYASADGSFSIGAKRLTFTAKAVAQSLIISSESGSVLFFAPEYDTFKATTTVLPQAARAETTLAYSIADESIATVCESGEVTAVAYGETVLSATTPEGLRSEFPVVVSPPKMNEPDVTNDYFGEPCYIELYTKGAVDLLLKNADGSDGGFTYSCASDESSIDGYDRYWIVTVYPDSPEPVDLRVYALDEQGMNAHTPCRFVHLSPIIAASEFNFEQSAYSFNRAGGAVKINLLVYPEQTNDYFNWAISSNTVASIKGYEDYCILTPRASGTLMLTASTTVDGEEISKTVPVTFTEGEIFEASIAKSSLQAYEASTVQVITDTSVSYLELEDETNGMCDEYNESCFYEDEGNRRTWSLPFYFRRASTSLLIWGGDSIGEITSRKRLSVLVTMPESGVGANPAVIRDEVGVSVALRLMSLPDRNTIREADYSVETIPSGFASYSNGYLTLLQEGEGEVLCTYKGEVLRIPITAYKEVQSVTLPQKQITLTQAQSFVLEPETEPHSTQTLLFESSNKAVAEVDKNGVILAKSPGEATISVRTKSGVKTDVRVLVKSGEEITALAFESDFYKLTVEQTLDYRLVSNLSDITNKVRFYSSNTNLLEVDTTGVFTAKKPGEVQITAIADSGVTATATVKIECESSLLLSREYVEVPLKNNFTVSAFTLPRGQDTDGFWFSDNEAVAVVNSSGSVSTKSAGTCTIYFLSDDGKIATCFVRVNSLSLSSVRLQQSELTVKVFGNQTLNYTKTPKNSDEKPRFISADESIAAVNENGIVYGISEGSTIIMLVLQNGERYPVSVTVTADDCTLSGKINCAATLSSENSAAQTEQTAVSGSFALENFRSGIYTLTLTAPHHTSLLITDAAISGNCDLGELHLHNGDANEDGVVDIADISFLLNEQIYGKSAAQAGAQADINDDGQINLLDIRETLLAENFGGYSKSIIF